MDAVDISNHADKYPDQLSGGQKQRVAIARALVTHAKLILADEPTANLDHSTAFRIIDLMKKMRDEYNTTFIFSTHDNKIMDAAEIIYAIEDGMINQTKGLHV
jgi:putative ABC transport system ATP-binding protein